MGPFDINLAVAVVGLTTPILLAAMGELVAQRSGIINIGLEGMVLGGAFLSFWAVWLTHSLLIGVVAGAGAGALLGAVMAVVSISLSGDQIVAGIGINILALGATTFANEQIFTAGGNQPSINPMTPLPIPLLDHIPGLGTVFFKQVPLAYFAYLSVPAIWYLLYRTNLGLFIRGAGEIPEAVETAGASVARIRWATTLFAGLMAGLGGAVLSIGNVGVFDEGMSGGRGYIALAAVIFGGWRPAGVLIACLIFGGADALQLRLQPQPSIPSQVWVALLLIPVLIGGYWLIRRRWRQAGRGPVLLGLVVFVVGVTLAFIAPKWRLPSEFWLMLPYVITLVVLSGRVGGSRLPAALGVPYRRAASTS